MAETSETRPSVHDSLQRVTERLHGQRGRGEPRPPAAEPASGAGREPRGDAAGVRKVSPGREGGRRDPALGSSVMITAITDSGGFCIFFGLATVFMV